MVQIVLMRFRLFYYYFFINTKMYELQDWNEDVCCQSQRLKKINSISDQDVMFIKGIAKCRHRKCVISATVQSEILL